MRAGLLLTITALTAAPAAVAQTATERPAIDARDSVEGKTIVQLFERIAAGDAVGADALVDNDFVMPRRWKNCAVHESDRICYARYLRETIFALEGRVELQKLRVERRIVRVNIALSNRSTREEAADRILLTDEFIVQGGKIRSFIRTPRTEDPPTHEYFRNRHSER